MHIQWAEVRRRLPESPSPLEGGCLVASSTRSFPTSRGRERVVASQRWTTASNSERNAASAGAVGPRVLVRERELAFGLSCGVQMRRCCRTFGQRSLRTLRLLAHLRLHDTGRSDLLPTGGSTSAVWLVVALRPGVWRSDEER